MSAVTNGLERYYRRVADAVTAYREALAAVPPASEDVGPGTHTVDPEELVASKRVNRAARSLVRVLEQGPHHSDKDWAAVTGLDEAHVAALRNEFGS